MTKVSDLLITSAILIAVGTAFSGASSRQTAAQNSPRAGKTVWDGVYSARQAARGQEEYESNCASCHSTGDGPALTGDAFMRRWFEDTLEGVFTKVRTTMPGDAPASLTDHVYLEIIAYLLKASGFPAGESELVSGPGVLNQIQIVEKGGAGGPVPNFSLVQIVGCLLQNDTVWTLSQGTEPARTRDAGDSTSLDLTKSAEKPLGNQTFQLMDLSAQSGAAHKGRKVQVKGFLIRQPEGNRLNVVSLQELNGTCPPSQ